MTHHNAKERPPVGELKRLYHDELLTKAQVAERVGVSRFTINQWFKDAGIECRPRGRASTIREMRKRGEDPTLLSSEPPTTENTLRRIAPELREPVRYHCQELLDRKAELKILGRWNCFQRHRADVARGQDR